MSHEKTGAPLIMNEKMCPFTVSRRGTMPSYGSPIYFTTRATSLGVKNFADLR